MVIDLYSLSTKFLKLANELDVGTIEQQLHRLLEQTIRDGDRDSWLVFCDLLEQEGGEFAREFKRRTQKSWLTLFEGLNEIFDDLVMLDRSHIKFKKPHFGKFNIFGFSNGGYFIEYDDFAVTYGSVWSPNKVKFIKNFPIFDQQDIREILYGSRTIRLLFSTTDIYEHGYHDIDEANSEYVKFRDIYNQYKSIAHADIDRIKTLFDL